MGSPTDSTTTQSKLKFWTSKDQDDEIADSESTEIVEKVEAKEPKRSRNKRKQKIKEKKYDSNSRHEKPILNF